LLAVMEAWPALTPTFRSVERPAGSIMTLLIAQKSLC
jgi:hypothetical protein